MSGVGTIISVTDGMSAPIKSMYNGVISLIQGLKTVKEAGHSAFDGVEFEKAGKHMLEATVQLKKYEEEMKKAYTTTAQVTNEAYKWRNIVPINIFDSKGAERYAQELRDINTIIEKVKTNQFSVGSTLEGMNIGVSPDIDGGFGDVHTVNKRVMGLSDRMGSIGDLNIDNLTAFNQGKINSEAENLRAIYAEIVRTQDSMKNNMQSNNLGGVNNDMARLSSLTEQAEIKMRDLNELIADVNNVQWDDIGSIETFSGTGVERARQEVDAVNTAYGRVLEAQNRITTASMGMKLMPPSAINDISTVSAKVVKLKTDFDLFSQKQKNIGKFNTTGLNQFSTGAEQIRQRMARIEVLQGEINRAIADNNIERVNRGYRELNILTDDVRGNIRNATTTQNGLNNSLRVGATNAKNMTSHLRSYAATALTLFSGKQAIDSVDSYTNASARLGLITDNKYALQKQVYASAINSRSNFNDSVSNVAKLGLLAGDAFGSTNEVVEFENLMNKSFKISGSSTQERSAGMYQLTQAMAAGKLQGDEFRSIMENAPLLAQAIADYTGKSKGQLKEMSADGDITAKIIKGALFNATDEINAKFDEIPKSFGDIGNELITNMQYKSSSLKEQVNNMLNSSLGTSVVNLIGEGADWGIARLQDLVYWVQQTSIIAGPNIEAIVGDFKVFANAIAGPDGEARKFLNTLQRIASSDGTRRGLNTLGGAGLSIAKGFNMAASAVGVLNQKFGGLLPTLLTMTIAYKTFQLTNSLLVSPINSLLGLIDSSVQRYNNLQLAIGAVTAQTNLMNIALAATKWLTIVSGIGSLVAIVAGLTAGITAYTNAQKLNGENNGKSNDDDDDDDDTGDTSSAYGVKAIEYSKKNNVSASTAQRILDVDDSYKTAINSQQQDYNDAKKEYDKANKASKELFWSDIGANTSTRRINPWRAEELSKQYSATMKEQKAIMDKSQRNIIILNEQAVLDRSDLYKQDRLMNAKQEYELLNEESFGTDEDEVYKVEVVDTVDIASEDLRYIKDLAEKEAINQFTSKLVQPQVTVTISDVKETVDLDAVINKMTNGVIEELNTSSEFVHY